MREINGENNLLNHFWKNHWGSFLNLFVNIDIHHTIIFCIVILSHFSLFFQDLDIVLSKLNKNLKEDNRIGREMILLTAFEQFHCLLNYVTMEFNEIFVIKNLDWFSVFIIDTFRGTSSIILKRPIIIYMFIKKKEFLLLFRFVIVYLLNLRRTW